MYVQMYAIVLIWKVLAMVTGFAGCPLEPRTGTRPRMRVKEDPDRGRLLPNSLMPASQMELPSAVVAKRT